MSSPDEAGDRAMLIERLKRDGVVLKRLEVSADLPNAIAISECEQHIHDAITALSSDAKDHRIAELESMVAGSIPAYRFMQQRAEAAESQLRLTGTEDAGVRALVEAIEPFAALARERYPEEGDAPSFIDIMTDAGMSDELELRTNTGPSDHTELLYGVDFRRAAAAVKPFRRT